MASKRSRTIRVLRGLLLLAFVVSVLGISGLVWFGNVGRRPGGEGATGNAAPGTSTTRAGTGDYVVEGESFRQAATQGERVLFEVQGGRYRADRSDNVFLEDVTITVERPNGAWRLRGETGRFNAQTKEARLEGEVAVDSPNGLSVAARWLELRQGGKVLVASRGTRYSLRDALRGESEHLRMDFERQVTVLSDGVSVRGVESPGQPAFELDAERVVFDQPSHRVDAEGKVRLRSDAGSLDAKRLTIQLAPDDRKVVGLRAIWDVDGWLDRAALEETREAPPSGSVALDRLSFSGTTLALDLDELERPLQLQLQGSGSAQAVLETSDATGTEHRLRATEVVGAFHSGRLVSVLARRPAEIEQRVAGKLQHMARARRALAAFDEEGRMVRVDLVERVALAGDDLAAQADRASLLPQEESASLWGDPVRLERAGDVVVAPEVVHRGAAGLVEARGGVRATLARGDGGGGEVLGNAAWGAGEGPVVVEAQEAIFQEAANETTFRGAVRAWRGTSLLVADQLRGDRGGESLAASGSVRTVWRRPEGVADAEERDAPQEEPDASGDPDDERLRQPVEITAQHLTYRAEERRLRYQGDVRVDQGAQTLSCRDLVIELDPEQEPLQYDCSGDARVVDRELSRTVDGTRVSYRPGEGEVEVFGDPVRLVDPTLGRVEGPRLWYSVEDGSVRMGAAPETSPASAPAAELGR